VGPACQLLGGARGFGPRGPEEGKRAMWEEEKKRWAGEVDGVGSGLGRLDRFVFFFFFLFFFKPIFKPISNLFKFKSFTSFQIQIFDTNFSNYF
jgi:hypothetical protein